METADSLEFFYEKYKDKKFIFLDVPKLSPMDNLLLSNIVELKTGLKVYPINLYNISYWKKDDNIHLNRTGYKELARTIKSIDNT